MKESSGFGLSPSVKRLRTELEKSAYKNAVKELERIRKTSPAFELNENEVNTWGYKLLKQNRVKDALEIFKLNVFLYQASANAFDSLGEIYAEMGDTALSIKNYEQSLKLDPKNTNAAEQVKRLRSNK